MKRLLCGTAAMLAALWIPVGGSPDAKLRDADLAWERGDYATALERYLALLDSSTSDEVFEAIALQTGELYRTVELTPDGAAPQFSPDGRHVAYETGTSPVVTRILPADSVKTAVELPGSGASFSPDGTRVVYLRSTVTPELQAAETAADTAPPAERPQRLAALNDLRSRTQRIVVRDLSTGRDTELDTGTRRKTRVMSASAGAVVFTGGEDPNAAQVFLVREGGAPQALTTDAQDRTLLAMNSTGTAVLFTTRAAGLGRGGAGTMQSFGIVTLPDGQVTTLSGTAPSFSADGHSLVYVARGDDGNRVVAATTAAPSAATIVRKGTERVDAPALSPDGSRVVFQMMSRDDWELYFVNRDGTGETRLTREIQHDILPRFLTSERLLATIGEPRHRRSYLYDVGNGRRTRLFHNNTVRTIAPEYAWVPNRDGTRVLIAAERDGDTVSPQRGVYLVDLSRKVSAEELRARLRENLAAERALRATARRLYAPVASAVRDVVAEASVARVYAYEKALFDFDSKHITRPGNKLAATYLFDTYSSFGYKPEYQWFSGRGAAGGQTANVIARLEGTVDPELVYVVSSHYDSVATGPGADDDSSGTAALLEAARILAGHPQPATILFASFTGEESGLLGSREFVRRAVASGLRVVGALNNDMIGWANDFRLDNTIRYSNPGIRDVQHAAAMQFTNLITYDALYYKGTDAAAYYEAYGDIVGGIGSYPVLGNPHYHQPHDLLDTINHQLVTEVAKTTAATLMLLASSPSRLKDLEVDGYENGTAAISWTAAPEKGVTGYIVAWGPPDKPEAQRMKVAKPAASVRAPRGTVVSVKAINARGLEGWDWARIAIK